MTAKAYHENCVDAKTIDRLSEIGVVVIVYIEYIRRVSVQADSKRRPQARVKRFFIFRV
jgi:hypothetical protein